MYVAEMIDYPLGPTAGRVRLLEDRDHDGRYEQATVFASGLNFPNGVLAARGGVFVTAAPDLLFLRDTDGDGRGRRAARRVHRLCRREPAASRQRADVGTRQLDLRRQWPLGRRQCRRPNDPPDKAVSIRGRDFRFRPDGSAFEATSGQSQFGQASDDWGNRFLSWNTIPIRQALFDQDFLDRNPVAGRRGGARRSPSSSETGRVFPISPRPTNVQPRADRLLQRAVRADDLSRRRAGQRLYLGNAFVGESLTNLVHRRLLTPDGPSFVSRRSEHGREFLASSRSLVPPGLHDHRPRRGAVHRRFLSPLGRASAVRGRTLPARRGRLAPGRRARPDLWKVSRRKTRWPAAGNARCMSNQPTAAIGQISRIAQRLVARHGAAAARRAKRPAGPRRCSRVIVRRQPACRKPKLHALAALDGIAQLDDRHAAAGPRRRRRRVRQFAMKLAARRLAGLASSCARP